MVNSCSAYGCKNRNSKGSTLTFHRFPLNNKALLKLWLYQIKRGGWEPSKYSVICSEHFTEDSFDVKGLGNGRRTLKKDAYPTIFSMAIYSEPPKRTFPGRKPKNVATEEDAKEDDTKDEDMKEADSKEDIKDEEEMKDEDTKDKNGKEDLKDAEGTKDKAADETKDENNSENIKEASVESDESSD